MDILFIFFTRVKIILYRRYGRSGAAGGCDVDRSERENGVRIQKYINIIILYARTRRDVNNARARVRETDSAERKKK